MYWHKSCETEGLVMEFHDEVADYPAGSVNHHIKHAHHYADYFKTIFAREFDTHFEVQRVGSTVDGSRVQTPVEFDFFFYEEFEGANVWGEGRVNYYRISDHDDDDIDSKSFGDHFLHGCREAVQNHGYLKDNSKLQPRGYTSNLLTVFSPNGEVLFEMDLIPGVLVNNDFFVPRGSKGTVAWFESFSVQEQEDLHEFAIDDCRMMTLRVIKAIRDRDPQLKQMPTGAIRNVLLKQMHRGEWDTDSLGWRVMRCLQALLTGYREDRISCFYNKHYNLLQPYTNNQLSKIFYRLRDLVEDEGEFRETLMGMM